MDISALIIALFGVLVFSISATSLISGIVLGYSVAYILAMASCLLISGLITIDIIPKIIVDKNKK